jgi:two-component system, cell cycle response regulator
MLVRKLPQIRRMTTQTSIDIPVRPRVLIADDSRIVRATLIKHIEGMFEFREALDGEQAWETLLLDPSIRVVITDLTMPKLDGYGLLQRIRSSKVSRIRDIPVVVVSGSDESEEHERAKAAGATDLITKGIGTAQLLSRLDILSKLVGTQREFEQSLEALVNNATSGSQPSLPSVDVLDTQIEALLINAIKSKKNFVILNICIGLRHVSPEGVAAMPPASVVDAIGQLLQRTVRQTDHVVKASQAEFMLATGNINVDAVRCFAQRICRAVANAHLVQDERMSFVASCGLVSLDDDGIQLGSVRLRDLQDIAHRRATLGLNHSYTGVVGYTEEIALERGERIQNVREDQPRMIDDGAPVAPPDLATLLKWIKEGRQSDVLPHIGKLSAELQPLVDLVLRQGKR